MLPKISIIMPVLNRGHTIEKAILSVINQHYLNVELIIMDGNSTDNTVDIIKRYQKYITYWQSKSDEGPAQAVNLGIEMATGDLIALLMADDWYEAETFNKVAAAYIAQPNLDMLTCGGRIVFLDNKTSQYHVLQSFAQSQQLALNFYNICFAASAICCRFIKKDFFKRIGLFLTKDKNGKHMLSNDKEFLMRAVLANVKDQFILHIGHTYLASKDSSTFGNHKKNILRLCKEHMEISENYLNEKVLNRYHHFLLIYWHNDQCTRLVLYYVLEGQLKKAFHYLKIGFVKYNLWFIISFLLTMGCVAIKKLVRLFRVNIKKA